ncbi:MAG TPA: sulfotransferase [Acidimicrobiales bacterium]
MAQRYQRPGWVRRLNVMADACGSAQSVVPIEVDDLLRSARQASGLDHFGDLGDGDWHARLAALVEALNATDLHVVGRLMTRQELVRGLVTRLRLADERRRVPSVADEEIVAPIVVTGPARSGTTILFELLALDPSLRSPRAADVLHPALPPAVSDDQRLARTECEQELWADVQPEFAAIHELRSDLPVECVTINSPSFAGSHWSMVIQELGEWVPDVGADFAWHRAVLQSLQHGEPPRTWVLKTPGYLIMLDDLVAAYPDVRIVLTHRDPAKTMPSTVSTTAMVQWMRTDAVDLDALSELIGAVFCDALAQVAQRRADGSFPAPAGDIRFADLLSNPVGSIRAAFDQIHQKLHPDHEAAIDAYLSDKPRGKHGVHRYTPEEWGFSSAELHDQLACYVSYFGIELGV